MLLQFIISFAIFSFSQARAIVELTHEDNYAIIFDAGSKGTRLYLFKYNLEKSARGNVYVESLDYGFEQLLYCELDDNGLGSYTSAAQIPNTFAACMKKAEDMIPAPKVPKTFISLIATAGMRLLEIKNKKLCDELLQGVRDYFRKTSFLYIDDSQVRIIDGWEEGIYALLASNYLKNEFPLNSVNNDIFGVIDIGGASAQIAYVPKGNDLKEELLHALYVHKNKYTVYSYSHLCYGTAQILTMYSSKTIRSSSYTSEPILASCYPSGYDFKYTGEELLDTPCVNGMLFGHEHDFTLDTGKIDPKANFVVSGNSKKNKCRDEVRLMTQELKPCTHGSSCSIGGAYQPDPKNNRYLALGNLFEAFDLTSKLYNIPISTLDGNMTEFSELTYDLCSLSYKKLDTLNKDNKAGIGKNRLAKLCLENVYLMQLLELLGFNDLKGIFATEYIDGKKVNWILGILIYELNHLNGFLNPHKNV